MSFDATTITRWWWVRHAPVVTDDPQRIWGQTDLPCDTSDTASLKILASRLPVDAVWVCSQLKRTHETAGALADIGGIGREHAGPLVEPDLAEQNLGIWQGMTWEEVYYKYGAENRDFWQDPGSHCPPGGESFAQVMVRTEAVVGRLTALYAGRDIVAISHGGTIRAALGVALGMEPRRALSIEVDTLSLTRLDHIDGPPHHQLRGVWRIGGVNFPAA